MLDRRRVEGGLDWLPGNGDMAVRIAEFDWSRTVLGPVKTWPQSRRTAIDIMLGSPMAVCTRWGQEGIILYNDAYAALAGAHHPALLGSAASPDYLGIADFTPSVMERGLRGESWSLHEHHLVVLRHGVPEDAWVDLTYSPLLDEAGQPAGVIGMVTDVTSRVRAGQERQRAMASLASVNERLDLLLAAGPVLGGWAWDTGDGRLRADEPFARTLGLDPKRVEGGMKLLEILQTVHSEDHRHVVEAGRKALRDGGRFQTTYRALHTNGGYRWVEASGRCDHDMDGKAQRFFGVLIDVSGQKQAELALYESETRFRIMADSAPALIWATDAEGHFTFANRRHETEFGLNLKTLTCADWQRTLHEDDADAAVARFYGAVKARLPVTAELRMHNKRGELRWMRCDAVPRFDDAGKFLGYTGCNVDMTELYLAADVLEAKVTERTQAYLAINEQLQAEMRARERAEHALRQAYKMEAVGQLTGGLAHDFNNLLTGIIGNLELMQNRAVRTGITEFDGYVEGARSAARRAAALTHRLLAFSRRQTLEPRQLRIEEMMEDVEELIRRTVGPAIDVRVRHAPDLWPTHCDQNQLENALLNLAINARDAMPEGGSLTIETENVALGKDIAIEQDDLASGDYITVSVSDTGTGMTEDVVMRAFDPFFTTKPSGQGTGLGLSMIYGFVKQSGGHIRILSEIGQGTTVRMYLPRCLDAAIPEPEPPPVDMPCGGNGEKIMIVDDESSVRFAVTEMLSDLDYDVVAAEDGPSALAMLETSMPVDLLIADIGLPGMNGQQLAEAAKLVHSGLKVLFITGYAEHGQSAEVSPEPGMHIVAKPFTMAVLAAKIHAMMNTERSVNGSKG